MWVRSILSVDNYQNQFWYLNGKLHREDGPACIYTSGARHWYINGRRHRDDGPALIYADGFKCWYLNGKKYTNQSEYQRAGNISDDDMSIILMRYSWK